MGTGRRRALVVWGEGRAQDVRQSGQLEGLVVHGGGVRMVRQKGEGRWERETVITGEHWGH